MNPEYFQVRFSSPLTVAVWQPTFAIITAWPTTGDIWQPSRIGEADRKLVARLESESGWVVPLTGYSPATGHSEPGWGAEIGFEKACDIGQEWLQDAVYFVQDEILSVSFCDHRRKLFQVGKFFERFDSHDVITASLK